MTTTANYRACKGCDKRLQLGEFPYEIRMGAKLRSHFCNRCHPHREYLDKRKCPRCRALKMLSEYGPSRDGAGRKDRLCVPCREDVETAKDKRKTH